MPHGSSLSVQELLQAAKRAGFSVSRHQLRRYQQLALLPAPQQVGLGRGKGTTTSYPPGSADQLVHLCSFLRHDRSFDRAAWRLWWSGHPIPDEAIRKVLRARLDDWTERWEGWRKLHELEGSEEDQAWVRIGKWARGPLPHKPLRRIRKRVGLESFGTFVSILGAVTSGTYESKGDSVTSDIPIIAKGFGFADPREYQSLVTDPKSAITFIQTFSGLVTPTRLADALSAHPPKELEQARAQFTALFQLLPAFWTLAGVWLSKNLAKGMDRLGIAEIVENPHDQQMFFLLWLAAHNHPIAQTIYQRVIPALTSVATGSDPADVAKVLDAQEQES